MIEQTWFNTPFLRINLTNGRALIISAIFILWMVSMIVIGFGFGNFNPRFPRRKATAKTYKKKYNICIICTIKHKPYK